MYNKKQICIPSQLKTNRKRAQQKIRTYSDNIYKKILIYTIKMNKVENYMQ